MSGLAGLFHLDGAPVDPALLQQLTRSLAFRGPDAQQVWVEGPVGLGHTLLRTTFESETEQQPFNLKGELWIVADARLDGRAALLADLHAHGHDLAAHAPDVELLLHAYAVWGPACVEHLLGDFAFAIWDGLKRQLFCARDHFGVVPFFYAQVGQTFVFSNTLNTVRLHPGVSARLNEQALADFLLFNSNQDRGATTFADIQRLPPAHCLTVSSAGVQVRRYWALPEGPQIQYRPPGEIVARFRDLFSQAVADRLRTDRVSVPMSGGLDSSSIAVTAKRLLEAGPSGGGVQALTVTADHLIADEERYYAGLVAAHAGLPIEYLAFDTPDLLDNENQQPAPPEPSFRHSGGAGGLGPRLVQFGRVALSGLGGDPLLHPSNAYLAGLLRDGHWLRLGRVLAGHAARYGRLPPMYARTWLKQRLGRLPLPPLPAWLNPDFARRLDLPARWQQNRAQQRTLDTRHGMAELPFWSNLLASADPGWTLRPIKVRYPFFDVRLVEFALSVPPVPWFVGKILLREAMQGELPEAVLRRPKAPLAADPIHLSAQQRSGAWQKRLAQAPELAPYVDRAALQGILDAPASVTANEYRAARTPLVLADWLRRQAAPPPSGS